MCFNFVTGRLLLNFFCNLFECKSSLHFHHSLTNLTAQTTKKHGLEWFRKHVLCLQQQWKHCLTLWDSYIWQQIPRTRATKLVLVKRRKQRVEGGTALASVCLCLSAPLRSHWSMQTFCPYAQQTLQKQQRLLFLSDNMTTHISVKNGQKPWWYQHHRQRSNATSWQARSQRRLQTHGTWSTLQSS